MSVPAIVYTMPDDKSPVRGRPESSNVGFGRPDSFMPTRRESAEDMLKSAVTEEKKFKHSP